MGSLGISGAVNKGVSLLRVRTKAGDLEEIRMTLTSKKYSENLPSFKDPNNRYERSKTAKVVKDFLNSWDWCNISKKNLSEKGLFLEFITDIMEEAQNKKWCETWHWFTVREYYRMICKNKLGQRFKCDVTPYGKEEKINIANIKKTMKKFNFTEYWKRTIKMAHWRPTNLAQRLEHSYSVFLLLQSFFCCF